MKTHRASRFLICFAGLWIYDIHAVPAMHIYAACNVSKEVPPNDGVAQNFTICGFNMIYPWTVANPNDFYEKSLIAVSHMHLPALF